VKFLNQIYSFRHLFLISSDADHLLEQFLGQFQVVNSFILIDADLD